MPEYAPEPFLVDVEPAHGQVRVIPRGEIDLVTVDEVDARLRELHEAGFDRIVLDLRDVTFMDSTGLRLILAWDDESRRNGMEFRLVQGPPLVRRLFEITGVLDRLRFADGETRP